MNRPMEARAGLERGRTILANILMGVAPSSSAASYSVPGIPSKKLFIRIMLYALRDTGSTQVISLEFRDSNYEDMFLYLTIELIKQEDGWNIQFYGLEG